MAIRDTIIWNAPEIKMPGETERESQEVIVAVPPTPFQVVAWCEFPKFPAAGRG